MVPPTSTPSLRKPRKGDSLEVDVLRLDPRGRARGRAQHPTGEYDVHLRRGGPGARVSARVIRRRGQRIDGAVTEVLDRGPCGAPPRCVHFGTCGGCSLQDLAYGAQLEAKRRRLEEALSAAGALLGPPVEPCVGADDPWAYRNKMDFTFSARRFVAAHEPEGSERAFALGLHPAGLFSKVFDLEECPIQDERCTAIVHTARRLARAAGLEPWHIQRHEGLLRHLVLRASRATGEILAVLTTSEEAPERVRPYAAGLVAAHPEIATLVQSVQVRSGQTAVGERELVLHGSGVIRERLAGLELELSARSFFQTNTAQAERLVEMVREEAELAAGDVLYDLYCGTGALGLALARDCREVRGYELVEEAVRDARRNAVRNGIENARFRAGDVLEMLRSGGEPAPTVVVVDPPRAGLHPKVLPLVAALPLRRMVYVSCNPAAAGADVAALAAAGLRLVRVRPIDLFPHTPHVETVLTLERTA